MTSQPTAPSWPWGKWFRTPHRENPARSQCQVCQGGGTVNGCDCSGGCDGRGWFDAANKPPRSQASGKRKARIS